jgi:6,7-dimethyl-8-ribityllumazine synthase
MKVYEGKLQAEGKRFGIVLSRFNSFIAERLLEGALDTLNRSGAGEYHRVAVGRHDVLVG